MSIQASQSISACLFLQKANASPHNLSPQPRSPATLAVTSGDAQIRFPKDKASFSAEQSSHLSMKEEEGKSVHKRSHTTCFTADLEADEDLLLSLQYLW